MPEKKKCKDHLGNEFDSISSMCDHYHISKSAYRFRIKNGWSIEKALTVNIYKHVCDHLGNMYKSTTQMCKHYGIGRKVYDGRIKKGWSVEKALTTPIGSNKITDHMGKIYESTAQMCKCYGISQPTYIYRIKKGWSVEKALTTNLESNNKKMVYDHLGNGFESASSMCEYYGIPYYIYKYRIKNGWSVKDALCHKIIHGKNVYDHLGNEYNSVTSMCKHYGISVNAFNNRLRKGVDIETALTKPMNYPTKYIDPVTHEELTINQIIDKYNLNCTSCNLRERIYKYDAIVRVVDISFMLAKNKNIFNKTKYDLTVVKRIKPGKDVFECYINNPDGSRTFKIMSYDMIDEYCLNKYKESMEQCM